MQQSKKVHVLSCYQVSSRCLALGKFVYLMIVSKISTSKPRGLTFAQPVFLLLQLRIHLFIMGLWRHVVQFVKNASNRIASPCVLPQNLQLFKIIKTNVLKPKTNVWSPIPGKEWKNCLFTIVQKFYWTIQTNIGCANMKPKIQSYLCCRKKNFTVFATSIIAAKCLVLLR